MQKIVEIAWYHYEPIYKVRFITIIRDYLQCDLAEAQNILSRLLEGQIVRLRLDLPIGQCDTFLLEVVELRIAIRYYSWHEEEPDGGLRIG